MFNTAKDCVRHKFTLNSFLQLLLVHVHTQEGDTIDVKVCVLAVQHCNTTRISDTAACLSMNTSCLVAG